MAGKRTTKGTKKTLSGRDVDRERKQVAARAAVAPNATKGRTTARKKAR